MACFHREGAWLSRIVERAASVVEFPIHGFARPVDGPATHHFARWCRRERIAVVQTCDLYANIFGLPGAALAGVPVRIGSRRELNPDKTAGRFVSSGWRIDAATKVVANSPAARRCSSGKASRRSSIAVIPNGVDLNAFADRKPTGPSGPSSPSPTCGAEKSHDTLLRGGRLLLRTHPDLRFLIVGDGPRRSELEELSHARGLAAHVEFLGHREDVPALLAAADAFVLPSRSEAFPNGVIEAMAAGLPVVASDVGGLLDLIDNGRTGLLVPPGRSRGAGGGASTRSSTTRPRAEAIGRRRARTKSSSGTRSIAWSRRSKISISRACARACPPGPTRRRRRESDMCGIAGRFNYDPRRPVDRDVLAAMTDAVAHRGPDAAGYYHGAGHRPRPSPAEHHRSRDRRSAARQRGRLGLGRLQRRDLQLRRAARRARARAATASAPAPTPKSSSTATRSGATLRSSASAACSRSRSGTPARAGCCSPAIASASSRSTTRELPGAGSSSGRRSSRCCEDPDVSARLEPRRARCLPDAALRAGARHDLPRRSASCRPGTSSSPSAGSVRISRYWDLEFTGDGDATRARRSISRSSTPAARIRRPAADQRRAARRVPVRRHRLVRRRRLHDRGERHAAGHDRGRLRRPRVTTSWSTRRPSRGISAASSIRAWSHPHVEDAAAEARVALRRAVRRLLGRADLLRLEGGARARHRRALGRRRRRALGRLRAAPRRAAGNSACARALGSASAACRLDRPGAAALGQGRAVAAASRVGSRPGVRAQARLRHVRAEREVAPLLSRLRATRCATPIRSRSFRDAYRELRLARSARSRALRRRAHLPGRRHPDEGRPDEHGGLARGARAAARSQAARVRRARCRCRSS